MRLDYSSGKNKNFLSVSEIKKLNKKFPNDKLSQQSIDNMTLVSCKNSKVEIFNYWSNSPKI